MAQHDNDSRSIHPYLNVLLIIATFIAILSLTGMTNAKSDLKDSERELSEVQSLVSERTKENKAVEDKYQRQSEKIYTDEVVQVSKEFNDNFFKWNGWGQYISNMESLQKTFPHIHDDDVVDISGLSFGTGEGPDSSYISRYAITSNPNEITELIIQEKDYKSKRTESLWYKVSSYDKGRYDIDVLENVKKL